LLSIGWVYASGNLSLRYCSTAGIPLSISNSPFALIGVASQPIRETASADNFKVITGLQSRLAKANFGILPTVTPSPTPIISQSADINRDGHINALDLFIFSRQWHLDQKHPSFNPLVDFYKNGTIDQQDLRLLLEHWYEDKAELN